MCPEVPSHAVFSGSLLCQALAFLLACFNNFCIPSDGGSPAAPCSCPELRRGSHSLTLGGCSPCPARGKTLTETCFQHQHIPATRQPQAKSVPQTQLAPNEGRHFSTVSCSCSWLKAQPGHGRCGAGGREGRGCLQLQGPIGMRQTHTYMVIIELPSSHGAARSRKSKPDALHQTHEAFASLYSPGK